MINSKFYNQPGRAAVAVVVGVVIIVAIAVVYFITQQPAVTPTVSDEGGVSVPVAAGNNIPIDNAVGEAVETSQPAPTNLAEPTDEMIVGNEAGDVATKTFNINGVNFSFSQPEIRVKQGDKVKIVFTSADGFHDWTVDEFNAATEQVSTGDTSTVEFVADKPGTFAYYCSVGKHRELGMVGNLVVE